MSLGLVYAILFLITISFASIGQKMITRDKMPVAVQNFYFRYLIGILIGLIGSTIIALNDKKPQSRTINNNVLCFNWTKNDNKR
jgi:hypothetical protein